MQLSHIQGEHEPTRNTELLRPSRFKTALSFDSGGSRVSEQSLSRHPHSGQWIGYISLVDDYYRLGHFFYNRPHVHPNTYDGRVAQPSKPEPVRLLTHDWSSFNSACFRKSSLYDLFIVYVVNTGMLNSFVYQILANRPTRTTPLVIPFHIDWWRATLAEMLLMGSIFNAVTFIMVRGLYYMSLKAKLKPPSASTQVHILSYMEFRRLLLHGVRTLLISPRRASCEYQF